MIQNKNQISREALDAQIQELEQNQKKTSKEYKTLIDLYDTYNNYIRQMLKACQEEFNEVQELQKQKESDEVQESNEVQEDTDILNLIEKDEDYQSNIKKINFIKEFIIKLQTDMNKMKSFSDTDQYYFKSQFNILNEKLIELINKESDIIFNQSMKEGNSYEQVLACKILMLQNYLRIIAKKKTISKFKMEPNEVRDYKIKDLQNKLNITLDINQEEKENFVKFGTLLYNKNGTSTALCKQILPKGLYDKSVRIQHIFDIYNILSNYLDTSLKIDLNQKDNWMTKIKKFFRFKSPLAENTFQLEKRKINILNYLTLSNPSNDDLTNIKERINQLIQNEKNNKLPINESVFMKDVLQNKIEANKLQVHSQAYEKFLKLIEKEQEKILKKNILKEAEEGGGEHRYILNESVNDLDINDLDINDLDTRSDLGDDEEEYENFNERDKGLNHSKLKNANKNSLNDSFDDLNRRATNYYDPKLNHANEDDKGLNHSKLKNANKNSLNDSFDDLNRRATNYYDPKLNHANEDDKGLNHSKLKNANKDSSVFKENDNVSTRSNTPRGSNTPGSSSNISTIVDKTKQVGNSITK